MDELKPSEDLRQRCSDILDWRQTGSLPSGAALRAFAEQPRFDRHESDRLRAAEDATLHEAATLIATWNTRAASGGLNEPFGNPEQLASLEQRAQGHIAMLRSLRLMYDDGVFGDGDHLGTTAALDAAIAALANQQGVEVVIRQYQFRQGKSPAWYDEGTGPTPDAWHQDAVQPDHIWRTLYSAPPRKEGQAND